MNTARTVAEVRAAVRAARAAGKTVGFVPTMGAFHAGHLSLMRRARERSGFVVVSLFVNPAQFNDPSDLAAYPRDERADAAMAGAEGVDLLFAPEAAELYAPGHATTVIVRGLSDVLEGAARGAAHFHGVTTIVAKLFNVVQPDVAFFGQKDAQQALIVRRMARDLDFPLAIEVRPTVREADGLAMSSRNVRLTGHDRRRALALRAGLTAAERAIAAGERDGARIAEAAAATMRERGVAPEYFALVSADTLEPVDPLAGRILVAVAAPVGPVRLIDNVIVDLTA
ncbi:MAG: pantoate--beta-alanine ligase [Gemmatimonadota bacterium]|nr:pantoate--beta-alanine ligase [Gemmatimonadota bacterium]